MKLFKTQSADLPMQNLVFIIAESDKTSLVQLDNRGRYTSNMEGIVLTEGKYAISKDQFFNALSVMGKGFTIEAKEGAIVFTHNNTEIVIKTIEMDIPVFETKEYTFKDIPENFMALINEAALFTNRTNNVDKWSGIRVIDTKVYATESRIAFKGELNGPTGLDVLLPNDILSVIKNPTQFDATENGNIVLKSAEGIAVIKTLDLDYNVDQLDALFKEKPKTASLFAEGALKQVNEAITDAKTMGHIEIIISKDATIYGSTPDMPEVKKSVAVSFPASSQFYISKLRLVLKEPEVYGDGGQSPLYVYGKDKRYIILPSRIGG